MTDQKATASLRNSSKADGAYRTISEVAHELELPQHVLRFWESRFGQIRPLKRGGGRRYYRPEDIALLKGIQHLLYSEGYTIKGVQKLLKAQGAKAVQEIGGGKVSAPFQSDDTEDDFDEVLPSAEITPFNARAQIEPANLAQANLTPEKIATSDLSLPLFDTHHDGLLLEKAVSAAPKNNGAATVAALRKLRDEVLACKKLLEPSQP